MYSEPVFFEVLEALGIVFQKKKTSIRCARPALHREHDGRSGTAWLDFFRSTELFTVEFTVDYPGAPNCSSGLQEPIQSTVNSTVVCSHDMVQGSKSLAVFAKKKRDLYERCLNSLKGVI